MNQIMTIIGFCLFAYLSASIPFGKIIGKLKIGKLKSVDLQKVGSGNIGATNAIREAGWLKGVPILVLELGKAIIPVFLAVHVLRLNLQNGWQPNAILSLVVISALLGSIFSVFLISKNEKGRLQIKGGKGIAVLMSSLLVILGWEWLLLGACFIGIIIVSGRRVSIGSLAVVAIFMPLFGYFLSLPVLYYLWIPASILIFWSHRENREKINKGEEPSFPIPNIFKRSKNQVS